MTALAFELQFQNQTNNDYPEWMKAEKYYNRDDFYIDLKKEKKKKRK